MTKNKKMTELVDTIIQVTKLKQFNRLLPLEKELAKMLKNGEVDVNATDENGQKAGAFIRVVKEAGHPFQDERVVNEMTGLALMMIDAGANVHTPIKGDEFQMDLVETAYRDFPRIVPMLTRTKSFDPDFVCDIWEGVKNMSEASPLSPKEREFAKEATSALIKSGVDFDDFLAKEFAGKDIGESTQDFIAGEMLKANPHSGEAKAFQIRKTRAQKQTRAGKKVRRDAFKAIQNDRKTATKKLDGNTPEVVREAAFYLSLFYDQKILTGYDYFKGKAKEKAVVFHQKHPAILTALGKTKQNERR